MWHSSDIQWACIKKSSSFIHSRRNIGPKFTTKAQKRASQIMRSQKVVTVEKPPRPRKDKVKKKEKK
ncbi:hypothetical protein D917_02646 [Trichinella nativa]|uniref:Uncharacterized protein n=1 Tax=Trichinella nativa TaxID=6335 RepID=A0A1Y3ED27_9BILA|nr:hypothetical protein D917_02646 [Trichinella nativa]